MSRGSNNIFLNSFRKHAPVFLWVRGAVAGGTLPEVLYGPLWRLWDWGAMVVPP
uniref:Uncharacterized protein n=1 Tax=Xanthomonas phage MK21 TaxID=3148942 RepID=A0AAU7J8T8_9CAUD